MLTPSGEEDTETRKRTAQKHKRHKFTSLLHKSADKIVYVQQNTGSLSYSRLYQRNKRHKDLPFNIIRFDKGQ